MQFTLSQRLLHVCNGIYGQWNDGKRWNSEESFIYALFPEVRGLGNGGQEQRSGLEAGGFPGRL